MKWLHHGTDDDNDDFIQMKTANESDNGKMPRHSRVFVTFEKDFDDSKYKKNVTLCGYLYWKNYVT